MSSSRMRMYELFRRHLIAIALGSTLLWSLLQYTNDEIFSQPPATSNYYLPLAKPLLADDLFGERVRVCVVSEPGGNSSKLLSSIAGTQFTLLVPFTPNDCNSCFAESDVCEVIADDFMSRIPVIGISSGASKLNCAEFVQGSGISISVWYDESELLGSSLGIDGLFSTPVKLLVSSDATILYARIF